MSDLTFNKIAGAVLATALAIVGLEELSAIVYQNEPTSKPGYAITVATTETGGGPAAPVLPPDWGTVLPTADLAAGKTTVAVCMTCHNLDKGGPNMTGPNLYGVLGRKPGSHPGFAYSPGMVAMGDKIGAWTYDDLDKFLSGPQADVSGTKMTFTGLKKQDQRINVIAYLRTLNDSPPPIPAPKPAAATAAAAPAAAAPAAAAPAAKP
ncbi:MAG TPA: cytochrome c family protein [Caulobacteraceae bacterium]|nr:cytochrome c family protein [Caulobacteraceae bacterium]